MVIAEEYPDSPQAEDYGCCERTVRFSDLFPMDANHSVSKKHPLDGGIDVAYYALPTYKLYFFKGEKIWIATATQSGGSVSYKLRYAGNWYDTWYDICDP